jgi:hypothetical protein
MPALVSEKFFVMEVKLTETLLRGRAHPKASHDFAGFGWHEYIVYSGEEL